MARNDEITPFFHQKVERFFIDVFLLNTEMKNFKTPNSMKNFD